MIKTVLTVTIFAAPALAAAAQCRSHKVGQCPAGYTESGGYCAPMRPDAPMATPKVPGKQCPSGSASAVSYCVEMRRR
jgi:hypothetical protein